VKEDVQRSLAAQRFLQSLDGMGIYRSAQGHRAVHKPLLVLMALASIQDGGSGTLRFNEVEEKLQRLIEEFGNSTSRSAPRAHYPFWYLKTDGFWFVDDADALTRREGKPEPRVTALRKQNTVAGFIDPIAALLRMDSELVMQAAKRILDRAFPPTLFVDVLDAVGLELRVQPDATKRDANFRRTILRAYSARCAVCRFRGHLRLRPLGIEAAHIKWVQYGGPNSLSNGMALCSLHHKLFDIGAFTIEPGALNVVVSGEFDGDGTGVSELLALARKGAGILTPQRPEEAPAAEFLEWHKTEVFIR
jgi:putative restriction endonuclease